MQDAASTLLEPIMSIEVVTLTEASSGVISDLTRRRAQIKNIDVRGHNKIIVAKIPLSELLGYATELRILTSGNANSLEEIFSTYYYYAFSNSIRFNLFA